MLSHLDENAFTGIDNDELSSIQTIMKGLPRMSGTRELGSCGKGGKMSRHVSGGIGVRFSDRRQASCARIASMSGWESSWDDGFGMLCELGSSNSLSLSLSLSFSLLKILSLH